MEARAAMKFRIVATNADKPLLSQRQVEDLKEPIMAPFLLRSSIVRTKKGQPLTPAEKGVPLGAIERRIYLIREKKVMLSTDIAELYGVEPRILVQAVKRNRDRFPEDFMFQLSKEEFGILKSQTVISSWGGRRRATPYAFTEQGIAMLSSVLRNAAAVQVNIAIMRAFVRLNEFLATHKDLARRLEELEEKYDGQFRVVFDAIRKLLEPLRSLRASG
jgi:hypothetical protein